MNIRNIQKRIPEIILYLYVFLGMCGFILKGINPVIAKITNYTTAVFVLIYIGYFIKEKNFTLKDKSLFYKLTVLFICLFLGFELITIVLNPNKVDNLQTWLASFIHMIMICLLFDYSKKNVDFLANSFVFINFLICLTNLTMFMFHITFLKNPRFFGIYENANIGGIMMGIALCVSLYELYKKRNMVFHSIYVVLLMPLLYMAGSRGTTIFVVTAVCLFLLMKNYLVTSDIKSFLIKSVLIVAVVFIGYNFIAKVTYIGLDYARDFVIYNNGELRPDQGDESDSYGRGFSMDNAGRFILFEAGFKTFKDHPVFGVGLKNLATTANSYYDKDLYGMKNGGVHNIYIQILATEGITGFVCYMGIMISIVVFSLMKGIEMKKAKINNDKFLFILAFIAGFCVYGMVEANLLLTTSLVATIFWFMIGAFLNEYESMSA